MTGPEGNSEFCFPRILIFPDTKSRETLRFSGNKIHCFPRDQSLSVKYLLFLVIVIGQSPHIQGAEQPESGSETEAPTTSPEKENVKKVVTGNLGRIPGLNSQQPISYAHAASLYALKK